MTTFAIAVDLDSNDIRVVKCDDDFGAFPTKEAAARRVVEIVEERMSALRRSKGHARRILRAVPKGD